MSDLQAKIGALWQVQRKTVNERVEELKRLLAVGDEASLDAARELAHKLAGALGIYGWVDCSQTAHVLELMIRDRTGSLEQMKAKALELEKATREI